MELKAGTGVQDIIILTAFWPASVIFISVGQVSVIWQIFPFYLWALMWPLKKVNTMPILYQGMPENTATIRRVPNQDFTLSFWKIVILKLNWLWQKELACTDIPSLKNEKTIWSLTLDLQSIGINHIKHQWLLWIVNLSLAPDYQPDGQKISMYILQHDFHHL